MTATLVQTKTAYSDTATAPTATYTSATNAGNVLECRISWDKNAVSCTAPTGWYLIREVYISAAVSGAWYYKIADGTESVVAPTPNTNQRYQMCLFEWSGIDTLDVSATANSGASNTTSQTSGTTATTANANSTVFVFYGSDSRGNTDAGSAFTNSFTDEAITTAAATGTSGFYNARKEVSSTGTYESTYSTTHGTGDNMFGMIAVYYMSGGGGGVNGNRMPLRMRSPLKGIIG